MGKNFWEIYRFEKFWLCRQRTPVRRPVQTVGVEVGRQDNLWGRECSGNYFISVVIMIINKPNLPAGLQHWTSG